MVQKIQLSVHRVFFAFSLDLSNVNPQRKSVAGNNMPTSKMCQLLKLLEVFVPSRNLSTDLKSLNHTESHWLSTNNLQEKNEMVWLCCVFSLTWYKNQRQLPTSQTSHQLSSSELRKCVFKFLSKYHYSASRKQFCPRCLKRKTLQLLRVELVFNKKDTGLTEMLSDKPPLTIFTKN